MSDLKIITGVEEIHQIEDSNNDTGIIAKLTVFTDNNKVGKWIDSKGNFKEKHLSSGSFESKTYKSLTDLKDLIQSVAKSDKQALTVGTMKQDSGHYAPSNYLKENEVARTLENINKGSILVIDNDGFDDFSHADLEKWLPSVFKDAGYIKTRSSSLIRAIKSKDETQVKAKQGKNHRYYIIKSGSENIKATLDYLEAKAIACRMYTVDNNSIKTPIDKSLASRHQVIYEADTELELVEGKAINLIKPDDYNESIKQANDIARKHNVINFSNEEREFVEIKDDVMLMKNGEEYMTAGKARGSLMFDGEVHHFDCPFNGSHSDESGKGYDYAYISDGGILQCRSGCDNLRGVAEIQTEEEQEKSKTISRSLKRLLSHLNELYMDKKKLVHFIDNIIYDATKSKFYILEHNQLKVAGKNELHVFIDNVFKQEAIVMDEGIREELVEYYISTRGQPVVNIKNDDGKLETKLVEISDTHLWSMMYEEQKVLLGVLKEYLIRNRQFKYLKVKVDPYMSKNTIKIEPFTETAILTYNTLLPKVPKKIIDDEIVDDYKEHFKELDELLDVVIASRFGADTKEAYLWMKLNSNWGKSFLFQGVFKPLGLATMIKEKEVKKAYAGEPVGMVASEFTHSMILVFDEFKGAVGELKDITHSLSFSSKNMPRTEVDLYLKLFLSAESVESLESGIGVEMQFRNRFMKWDDLKGDLAKREVFKKVGHIKYADAVRWYAYSYLKAKSDEMVDIGKEQATAISIELLSNFRSKYKFKTQSLDKGIELLAVEYLEKVAETLSFNNANNSIDRDHTFFREHFTFADGNLYINNIPKVKEHFIESMFAKKEQAKIARKDFKEVFMLDEQRYKKLFHRYEKHKDCYRCRLYVNEEADQEIEIEF